MKRRSFALAVVSVLAVGLLLVPVASAASGVVDCRAGASLQAAIDAAADGSTLVIKGTCVGSFLIADKNLTLLGTGKAVLDGGNAGRVLYVSGWVSGDVTVLVANMAIRNGLADDGNGGGGVLTQFSHVTLKNVSVTDNASVLGGGGIENDLSDLTLVNSTVSGNQATSDRGGGISSSSSNLTIRNSTVSGNSAGFVGGGIAITRGNATLIGSTVNGNTALQGGGISNDSGAITSVTNSMVSGNSAGPGIGGGIYNGPAAGSDPDSTMTITGSTIAGNSAPSSSGGGIENRGALTISRSRVTGNSALSAAGITNYLGTLTFIAPRTVVGGNTATFGAAIANGGGTVTGGCPTVLGQGVPASTATTGFVQYGPANVPADYTGFTC